MYWNGQNSTYVTACSRFLTFSSLPKPETWIWGECQSISGCRHIMCWLKWFCKWRLVITEGRDDTGRSERGKHSVSVLLFILLFDAPLIIHLPACFDHHSGAQAREQKNKCEVQSVNTSRARLCLVVMSSCISVMRGVVCWDSWTLWSTSGSARLLRHYWTLSSEIRTVSALLQCTVLPKSPLRRMSQTPQFGWQHCVLNMLLRVRINVTRA